jgi:hypothetical protein
MKALVAEYAADEDEGRAPADATRFGMLAVVTPLLDREAQ